MPKHSSSGQYAIVGLGVVAGQQPDRSERMVAAEFDRLLDDPFEGLEVTDGMLRLPAAPGSGVWLTSSATPSERVAKTA